MNYIAIGPARQMAGDAKRLAAVIRALNCRAGSKNSIGGFSTAPVIADFREHPTRDDAERDHSSQPSSLQGAIKATRGVIKKFRMWRARYTTQKSGKCLVCLAFREIPCGEQDCGNG